MLADDLKLYSIYNSANGLSDLQQSLDLLVSWSNIWQLKINISKCHVLSIRSKSRSDTFHKYLLDGVLLKNVSSTSDLGVNIDSNLSFKLHISTVITKAPQRVGLFFRGFSSRRFEKHLLHISVPCWKTTALFGILPINISLANLRTFNVNSLSESLHYHTWLTMNAWVSCSWSHWSWGAYVLI